MNVVGVPCKSCGHDGRAEVIEQCTEGPVVVGLRLRCALCGDDYPWLPDLPAS